jgi:hypothetical protein
VRTKAPDSAYPARDDPAPILGQGGMGGTGAAGGCGGGGGGPIETVSDGTNGSGGGNSITSRGPSSTFNPRPTSYISSPLQSSRSPAPMPDPEPTPTPTPTPTETLPESSPSLLAIVAILIIVANRSGALKTWSWVGKTTDAQREDETIWSLGSPLYRKGVGRTEPPQYPDSLGTFDLGQHKNYKYTGSSDSVGSIQCDDGYRPDCEAYPDDTTVDCAQPDVSRNGWFFRVRCEYGD